MKNSALVVGSNGIVGRNLSEYLVSTGCWDVTNSSFSSPDYESSARFVQLDLTDESSVAKQADKFNAVTHAFFASYVERKNPADQTKANTDLLRNFIDGLERVAPHLKHVVFIQGGKAYGAHLGRFKTPAKETDPRHMPPNFYYSQEDYLREKSQGKGWTWTAIRPDIITGIAVGNPMNIVNIIGVYAALCKELQVAFRFPGSSEAYNALANVTGAELLAEAMEWAALKPETGGEIFNITNGDVFRWRHVFPRIAKHFELELAEPLTFSLTEFMADKEEVWARIVKKHSLKDLSLAELVQWPFGDFIFNNPYDAFFDVNKARRAGFDKMNLDSGEQIVQSLKQLQKMKLIP